MDYSERIKVLKSKLSMKQSEFATYLGVSRTALSEFETGAREPSKDFILALGKKGISTDWFLSGEGEPFRVTNYPLNNQKDNKLSHSPQRLTSQPTIHEEANKIANSPLPDTPADSTIETSRQKPPGIPLVYEGDGGLEDGIVIPLLENAVSAGYGAELDGEDVPARYVQVPRFLAKYPHLASLPVKGDSMEPTLHDGDLVVCDGGGWDGDGLYVLKSPEMSYVKRLLFTPQGYQVISDNKMYPGYTGRAEDLSIVGKVRAILVVTPGRRGGV